MCPLEKSGHCLVDEFANETGRRNSTKALNLGNAEEFIAASIRTGPALLCHSGMGWASAETGAFLPTSPREWQDPGVVLASLRTGPHVNWEALLGERGEILPSHKNQVPFKEEA